MKKSLLFCTALLGTAVLFAADNEVPRQFRIWGRKAPFRLSMRHHLTNQVGMRSIRIPNGYKQEYAETNTAVPQLTEEQKAQSLLIFPFHPQEYIYYYTQPLASEIGKTARAIGTPGEYVQMAFALRSLKAVDNIEISVDKFADKSGNTVIPQNHVDLRRIMDLPLPGKSGKTYIIEPRYLESFEEFDYLEMKKNYTERFFLTVKIPDDAAPGICRSTVKVTTRNGGEVTLGLMIRVLPFKLMRPDPKTEMNFQILANFNDSRASTWGRDTYPHQSLRNMADLQEHGMSSAGYVTAHADKIKKDESGYVFDFDKPYYSSSYSFNSFMHMFKRAGLTGPLGYYTSASWHAYFPAKNIKAYSPEWQEYIAALAKAIDEQRKAQNWPDFIFFCGDEPGPNLNKQTSHREIAKAIRKGVPDAQLSNFFNGEWSGVSDWKILKEFSTINCANYFDNNIINESKKIGYKDLWLYNGIERTASGDARSYRIFYGYVPARVGATGVTQYHYRTIGGNDAQNLDFLIYDHIHGITPNYIMTYPAPDGPLPTQQWEAIRQGIYDYCYYYTLKKMIAECKDPALKKEAQKVVDQVVMSVPHDFMSEKRTHYLQKFSPKSLDTMRWKHAQMIMKLQKAAK